MRLRRLWLDSNTGYFKPKTDGTSVFSFQDKDGNKLLDIDTTNDKVTIGGDLTLSGTADLIIDQITSGKVIVDVTDTEALLVRKSEDDGDVFVVDTDNGRVGIGTASPGAKLDISGGDMHIDATQKIYLDGGNNTYISESSGDKITLTSAASVAMDVKYDEIIMVPTGGNVGIGTTSPQSKLHLAGTGSANGMVFGDAGDINLYRQSASYLKTDDGFSAGGNIVTGGGRFYVDGGSDTYIAGLGYGNDVIAFITGGNYVMKIDANGNVGIGTDEPGARLNVKDGTSIATFTGTQTGKLLIEGRWAVDEYTAIGFTSDNNPTHYTSAIGQKQTANGMELHFGVSNSVGSGVTTDAMVINHLGNVGIGTDEPGTLLQLAKDGDAYLTLQNLTNEHTEGAAETKIIFEDHANAALGQIEVSHSGTSDDTKGKMIFSTHDGSSLTTALTIENDGKSTFAGTLYLNETANTNMTQGITINQGANTDEILAFKGSFLSHPFTDIVEADTYVDFQPASSSKGGLILSSFYDEAATVPVTQIKSYGILDGSSRIGTGIYGLHLLVNGTQPMNADAAILGLYNLTTLKTKFLGDGDMEFQQASEIRTASNQNLTLNAGSGTVDVVGDFTAGTIAADNGANFNGGVTNITVVNGIVTAAS